MMSFFHSRDASMASYRYRAQIPSRELGLPLNEMAADVWIFAKPTPDDVTKVSLAHAMGKTVIVDICDPHFTHPHYRDMMALADALTAPTPWMADLITREFGKPVTVIEDPYEFPESRPHVQGTRCLWFGHPNNLDSLARIRWMLHEVDLRVMTAEGAWPGALPWSLEGLQEQLAWADCVLLPETPPYKSANRAVEAIRAGCLVVAEPHPSLREIPDIWMGDMQKGLTWIRSHLPEANARVTRSQAYVSARFSPERVANAWRTLAQAVASTSAAGINRGRDGSTWMGNGPHAMPMWSPI